MKNLLIYFLYFLGVSMTIVAVFIDRASCFIIGIIIIMGTFLYNLFSSLPSSRSIYKKRSCLKSFDVSSSNHILSINRGFEKRNISPNRLRALLYFPESQIIEVFYVED
jgi:hypothetical protein